MNSWIQILAPRALSQSCTQTLNIIHALDRSAMSHLSRGQSFARPSRTSSSPRHLLNVPRSSSAYAGAPPPPATRTWYNIILYCARNRALRRSSPFILSASSRTHGTDERARFTQRERNADKYTSACRPGTHDRARASAQPKCGDIVLQCGSDLRHRAETGCLHHKWSLAVRLLQLVGYL